MKIFICIKRILLFCVCFFILVGCGKADCLKNSDEGKYIVGFYNPTEKFFANIPENNSPLYMGGKEFFGGIVLGDTNKNNPNSYITFEIDKDAKYISFFLGSIHYSKAYFSNSEVVSVLIDGEPFLEEVIYNHSLPKYYEIFVEGAKTITFKTNEERIIAAVGELKFWNGKPSSEKEKSKLSDISRLMYDVEPYYISENSGLSCIYSKDGKKTKFLNYEYTDAIEVSFPKIEKWSNEAFAYFNLEGKYSFLSFNFGVEFLDLISNEDIQSNCSRVEENGRNDCSPSEERGENACLDFEYDNQNESFASGGSDIFDASGEENKKALALIEIYADEVLVFNAEMTWEKLESFRIPINNCEKLCFVFKSVPSVQDLKCILSGIYAES